MSTVKKINEFFKFALKSDIDSVRDKIALSERQEQIFDMFYIKKQDIGFIADKLYVSQSVINTELKVIRNKLVKVLVLRDQLYSFSQSL